MNEDLDGIVVLPCGCVTLKDGKVFTVKPCSLKCENYLYIIEQTKAQGKEVIYAYIERLMK